MHAVEGADGDGGPRDVRRQARRDVDQALSHRASPRAAATTRRRAQRPRRARPPGPRARRASILVARVDRPAMRCTRSTSSSATTCARHAGERVGDGRSERGASRRASGDYCVARRRTGRCACGAARDRCAALPQSRPRSRASARMYVPPPHVMRRVAARPPSSESHMPRVHASPSIGRQLAASRPRARSRTRAARRRAWRSRPAAPARVAR